MNFSFLDKVKVNWYSDGFYSGRVEQQMGNEGMSAKASKEFLEEIKTQFERDLKINSDLDSKSSNMITTSSAVSTLLMGIGTFLVSHVNPPNWIFQIDIIVLIFGILFSAISMSLFINSYRLQEFRYPLASKKIR